MKFIGITGGVGAGKSTVLDLLKNNFNCRVLLADTVAADLLTPGHDCFDRVVALDWPSSILTKDGIIDRPLMASFLYNSQKLRDQVNAIVHPAVKDEVLSQVQAEKDRGAIDYFFFEAALLIECGYGELVDQMWYIYADDEIRRKRLKDSRGYSDDRVDVMMASQLSDQDYRAGSDTVIDNGGSQKNTLDQLRQALDLL